MLSIWYRIQYCEFQIIEYLYYTSTLPFWSRHIFMHLLIRLHLMHAISWSQWLSPLPRVTIPQHIKFASSPLGPQYQVPWSRAAWSLCVARDRSPPTGILLTHSQLCRVAAARTTLIQGRNSIYFIRFVPTQNTNSTYKHHNKLAFL